MHDDPVPTDLAVARKLIEKGQLVEASNSLRALLESDPANAEAWFLMARLARLAGQLDMAAKMVATALASQPDTLEFLCEQAGILNELGQYERSAECHRRILRLDSGHFESHAALGRHHVEKGELQEAYRHLQAAAQLRPRDAEIYNLLGQVLLDAGVLDDAQNAFRACLEINPNHVQALLRLGNLHRERHQTGRAIQYYRRALAVKPDDPYILSNLGNAWLDLGESDEAIICYRESLRQFPDAPTTRANLIFALHYQAGISSTEIADAHREWGRRHTAGLPRLALDASGNLAVDRPLRVGLVSADFRQHPVGRLAQILCRYLNPAEFVLFVYDAGLRSDSLTQTLQSLVPNWRAIGRLADEKIARLIQQDRIDILVDLSGHSAGNRLLVFARHPAAIQIAMFAYPNTTGLEAMDYRVTDPCADPPGNTDALYTERLVRLAKTAWPYSPPPSAPEPQPAPVLAGHPFTFGCLNNPAKVSRAAIQLWSEILQQSSEARLMLIVREEPEHSRRLREKFAQAGARPHQLWLVPRAPLATYLEYHQAVDLMLDPFPYNGGVTTGDALWMGVPVLTLAGDSYVSRQGVSLLTNVGLTEGIASTPQEFLKKAIAWARAPVQIAELRKGLRERMRQSPLLDHKGYAEELGCTFRRLWAEHCSRAGANP